MGYDSPYDVTNSDYRYYVSKLINLDGRFYDLKISPAGDKLTLTPSSAPLGSVTNPNDGFTAVIFSGRPGLSEDQRQQGPPVAVPEGQWELLSYTINRTETPEAEQAGGKGREERERSVEAKDGGGSSELAEPVAGALGRRNVGRGRVLVIRSSRPRQPPGIRRSRSARARRSRCPSARRTSPS